MERLIAWPSFSIFYSQMFSEERRQHFPATEFRWNFFGRASAAAKMPLDGDRAGAMLLSSNRQ